MWRKIPRRLYMPKLYSIVSTTRTAPSSVTSASMARSTIRSRRSPSVVDDATAACGTTNSRKPRTARREENLRSMAPVWPAVTLRIPQAGKLG